ncbi:MAG: hypothetical protein QNJ72_11250 [Pleurocapsa sp. MO_226.B13]|nr:hypothetical protein [Pleurocapsa sp. MO_226.B13]
MSVPEWLRTKEITARFRVGQEDWQAVTILLNENGGRYVTPDGNESGTLQYLAHGDHPLGGEVLVLHWLEQQGPLQGNTGIDTLWLQPQDEDIRVCGTFFLDRGHDYGEIIG